MPSTCTLLAGTSEPCIPKGCCNTALAEQRQRWRCQPQLGAANAYRDAHAPRDAHAHRDLSKPIGMPMPTGIPMPTIPTAPLQQALLPHPCHGAHSMQTHRCHPSPPLGIHLFLIPARPLLAFHKQQGQRRQLWRWPPASSHFPGALRGRRAFRGQCSSVLHHRFEKPLERAVIYERFLVRGEINL